LEVYFYVYATAVEVWANRQMTASHRPLGTIDCDIPSAMKWHPRHDHTSQNKPNDLHKQRRNSPSLHYGAGIYRSCSFVLCISACPNRVQSDRDNLYSA